MLIQAAYLNDKLVNNDIRKISQNIVQKIVKLKNRQQKIGDTVKYLILIF